MLLVGKKISGNYTDFSFRVVSVGFILDFFEGSIHGEELLYLWSIAGGINTQLPQTEEQVMNYMVVDLS